MKHKPKDKYSRYTGVTLVRGKYWVARASDGCGGWVYLGCYGKEEQAFERIKEEKTLLYSGTQDRRQECRA